VAKDRRFLRWFVTRAALKRLAVAAILLAALGAWSWFLMFRMPGRSWRGPLPPLSDTQAVLRDALKWDVAVLAGEIGERNVLFHYENLRAAAKFIETTLAEAGYAVQAQPYEVAGKSCTNLSVEIRGGAKPGEIVVVGGHYDSVPACPGANDNGTGVAATLALARSLRALKPARTLRFVFFVNEEPPYFQSPQMGSLVYARACRERGEDVVAMLSLETIGCYLDEPRSQRYPGAIGLLYPSTGNFIAFVGNVRSRALVRQAVGAFRAGAQFPSEGGAVPGFVPGVGWSDHWAFWQQGYPAVMVTDTAPFRYRHYHEPTDTPDKIDYARMARVVSGLESVVTDLAQ
jgi:Zn-dependent M28 family amino/carboxypeptidase